MVTDIINNWHKVATYCEQRLSYLCNSGNWLIMLVVFLCVGFISCFIIKRFGHYIISVIVLTVFLLYVLSYGGFITFHIEHIKSYFGLGSHTPMLDFVWHSIQWIQSHCAEVVALVLGSFLAWEFL